MSRGQSVSWIAALTLATTLVSGSASAAPTDAGEPIAVTYVAPPSCPSREALLAQVDAHTARARAPRPDEAAHEFTVTIDAKGGRPRGRLEIAPSAGAPRQAREVTGATCEEVVEALAFFIALTIDPDASAAPVVRAPTAPVPPPAPASPPTPAPAPSATTPPSPVPPPRALVVPAPSADPRARRGRWEIGGGAGPALVGGVAPTYLFGARAVVRVTRRRAGDSIVSPSFSLSGLSSATGAATSRSGTVALRWQAIVADGCPIILELPARVALRPCAVLEIGVLRGEGVSLVRATRNDASWSAVGVAMRGELPLAWHMFLDLEIGASVPFDQPRFVYTSGTVAFDTPVLGARGALALVFHL